MTRSQVWMRSLLALLVGLFLVVGQVAPSHARFLTPDTWDPEIEGVDINRYAYALDDPINKSDPNGHHWLASGSRTTHQVDTRTGLLHNHGRSMNGTRASFWDGHNFAHASMPSSLRTIYRQQARSQPGGRAFMTGEISTLAARNVSSAILLSQIRVARIAYGAIGGSIRLANPTRGTQNCGNCVVATDAILRGRPASALPGGLTYVSALEKFYGTTFGPSTSIGAIQRQVANGGNGTGGIVFGQRIGEPGHFFNVINQNGVVRFLDGQVGGAANLNDGFSGFRLLLTPRN